MSSERLPNPRLELDVASQPVFCENCWRTLRMYPSSGVWLVLGNRPFAVRGVMHANTEEDGNTEEDRRKTGAGWVCECSHCCSYPIYR